MSRLRTGIVTASTLIVALLLMGAMLGQNTSEDGAYRQLAVYTEVLSRIKSEYVEEPDLKGVTLGALNGLLESIDPFASYLSADQYKEYLKHKDSYKGSTGLVLSKRFGAVGIVDSVPGSPADKAGLGTNDLIESIKGIATRDMPLAYAELLLQGPPGSTVDVTVLSMRNPESKKYTLTRAVVPQPKVQSKLLDGQIGQIEIRSINTSSAGEIAQAIKGLEKQGAKKLLLDLRHCASGAPEDGIPIANLFIDKGPITYVQGQRYQKQSWDADPGKAITKLPMVVATNRGTAGAAEVVAAALLDDKRAEVVGERTYGNAAIRNAIPMDDGGAVILSVAKFHSPSGKAIQDTGVTPTVQVTENEVPGDVEEAEPEGAEQATPEANKPDDDIILKKAIEVLNHGVPKSAEAQQEPKTPEENRGGKPPEVVTPDKPIK